LAAPVISLALISIYLSQAQTELYYPWVTHNQQYESTLVVNNLGPEPAEVSLTATRADGQTTQSTWSLAPFDQMARSTRDLFPEFGDGPGFAVHLSSSQTDITGAYVVRLTGETGSGSPAQANVVAPDAASSSLLFNYLPSNSEDGNAAPVLVNVGEHPAEVELELFQNGVILGEANVSIEPGRPFADLVTNLFPMVDGDVYVTASSDQPLLGVAFIFNARSEPSMSNAVAIDSIPPASSPGNGGIWVKRAPLLRSVSEMPHASLNGKLYIPGGAEGSSPSDQLQIYDTRSDSWGLGYPMPGWRHHQAVATHGGMIFVFGGYFDLTIVYRTVFAYDPQLDTWETRNEMLSNRAAAAAATVGDRIYLIGGFKLVDGVTNSMDIYDPLTDQWQAGPPMLHSREHLAAAAIDGKIYAVGGRVDFSAGSINNLEVFDPQSGSWRELAAMPTARSGLAAAVFDGKLYVFGGEAPGVFNTVEVFDPATESWSSMEPMPQALHGIGAATIGRGIYIFGGGIAAGRFNSTANGHVFYPPLQ